MTIQFTDMSMEAVGYIPGWLSEEDERGAVEQIHTSYGHGGGWHNFEGFLLRDDELIYPGDPPMKKLSEAKLRDERIIVYQHGWVAVVQPDNSFRVARID